MRVIYSLICKSFEHEVTHLDIHGVVSGVVHGPDLELRFLTQILCTVEDNGQHLFRVVAHSQGAEPQLIASHPFNLNLGPSEVKTVILSDSFNLGKESIDRQVWIEYRCWLDDKQVAGIPLMVDPPTLG